MSASKIKLANAYRSGKQYTADLYVYGVKVGHVEKGMTTGFGANQYRARVDSRTVADARTLTDLREELNEWIEEERLMEMDAIWLRKKRENEKNA